MFVITQLIHNLNVNENPGNLRRQHRQTGTLLIINRPSISRQYVIWTQVADYQGRTHQNDAP